MEGGVEGRQILGGGIAGGDGRRARPCVVPWGVDAVGGVGGRGIFGGSVGKGMVGGGAGGGKPKPGMLLRWGVVAMACIW